MKRVISFLVVTLFIVLLAATGTADKGFSLRNGIQFGDTMEDILAKETTLEREKEDSNWFKGKIAGYSNARCGFYFDGDGKLVSMDYDFSNHCTSRDSTDEVYKKLYQSLNRQYGKPKGNTGGTTYIITGPAIDKMAVIVYLLGSLDKYKGDYYDYDEWVVDQDGYHVKIDLVSYYYRDDQYEYSYYVDLSYHIFTDEELDAAINEKIDEQTEVDNDL